MMKIEMYKIASSILSWCITSTIVLCLGLAAANEAGQTSPASHSFVSSLREFALAAESKLDEPQAWNTTKEALVTAYNKTYDTLAPYFKKFGNLAETQAQRVVDNVVGYPAFIGEAAREKYLQSHAEELKKASSEEKQEILDTADGIATIGRLLSIGNALVTAVVPSALLGKWGDIAPSLLQTMSKSSLGLVLSPLLVGATYYLGPHAYQAYLHLVNVYKDVLSNVDAGTLSGTEAKQAQVQMLDALEMLKAESKVNGQ